ncbi:threonine/serine exporter family protein [Oscillibacter valericigenes]|uniref:Threonine/serine exporter family protein n=1 Tax=Oscillibacter valericigenes TaxID=351091 RepID=A0ABS2FTG0_9FIRM|nr:threonine/serine exporter family protein [Oscillibacter valericigenes]MBM6850723.1 threonine/serine exporter family protein [Oscillibacter valericigenes]
MDSDKLLNLATELGCLLAESGAEISRVEESVYRLLRAYQGEDAQVFAIPSCLIVSLKAEDGRPTTRMRRIRSHGTDIELLEACNALCRELCRTAPPLDEARARVGRLPASCRRHRPATVLLGYAAAPAFFCPLFGGGIWDALSAFFCGLVVGACLLFGGKWLGSNSFLRTLVCSGIASLLSLLLVRAGLGSNVDLVTIGVLMLLVPGVALTNAMRELVAGDTYSGLSRTAEAILIAMGIALGSAVGLGIGQIL